MNEKNKPTQGEPVDETVQPPVKASSRTPMVYCGPSVRGVAKQYTVYSGGLPAELEVFLKEHPAARGLLVSVERFAQVRQRLEMRGTAEAILYQKLRDEV